MHTLAFRLLPGQDLKRELADLVRREAIGPAKDRVQVVRAKLGTAAGIVGAALVGLEAAA